MSTRRVPRARGQRTDEHRHRELRRTHRHGRRTGLHRRHELRSEVPRVRQGHRRAPLGNDAALLGQRHAGDLRGRRPAVRRHRRGGRQGRRATAMRAVHLAALTLRLRCDANRLFRIDLTFQITKGAPGDAGRCCKRLPAPCRRNSMTLEAISQTVRMSASECPPSPRLRRVRRSFSGGGSLASGAGRRGPRERPPSRRRRSGEVSP